jgi:hypothetical protein
MIPWVTVKDEPVTLAFCTVPYTVLLILWQSATYSLPVGSLISALLLIRRLLAIQQRVCLGLGRLSSIWETNPDMPRAHIKMEEMRSSDIVDQLDLILGEVWQTGDSKVLL